MMPSKRKLWWALGIFTLVSGAAILRGVLAGDFVFGKQPWVLGNTISFYVGTSGVTAVVFALVNGFLAAFAGEYLWKLGEAWKMPKVYYAAVVLWAIGLIVLSVCLVYLFEAKWGVNTLNYVHEIASRTMFVMMAVLVLLLIWRRGDMRMRAAGWMYLGLALLFVVCYLLRVQWFMSTMLIWESVYVLGFLGILLVAREKKTT